MTSWHVFTKYRLLTDDEGMIHIYMLTKRIQFICIHSHQTSTPLFRSLFLTPQLIAVSSFTGHIYMYRTNISVIIVSRLDI